MGTHKRILNLKLKKNAGMRSLTRKKGFIEVIGLLTLVVACISLVGCFITDWPLSLIPFTISLLLLTPLANHLIFISGLLEREEKSIKILEEKEKAYLEGDYID